MSFIMRPIRFASTGHIIEGSSIIAAAGDNLTRTFGSTRSSARIFTFSYLIKRSVLATRQFPLYQQANGSGENALVLEFDSSDRLQLKIMQVDTGTVKLQRITTQVFRDTSAWLDIHIAVNTGLTTDACCKIHINGTEITAFDTKTNIDTARDHGFLNSSKPLYLLEYNDLPTLVYTARIIIQDGVYGVPTDVGEVTDDGFWQINDASELTFGTNGFLIEGGVDMAAGLDTSNGDYASTDTEVSLLMHMEGSDTSTTFLDSSRKGHILTANANAQIDTAVSKFGTSAALFDGNTDNISIPKNSALSFGTGDFIVEAWMNFDSVNTSSVWKTMCNVGTYFSLGNNSGNVVLYMASVFSDPLSLSTDTWYHICFSRVSGTVYFFVNGVAKGSASYSGSLGSTETHFIGAQNGANANPMDGHIDELRIIKGRGISSAFTPETSAYSNPLAANDFGKTGTITATNDSPTNDADNEYGNYCTWNPLDNSPSYLNTYSEGNLKVVSKSGNAFMRASPTMFVGSGKYYAEIKFTANAVNGSIGFLSSAAGHRSANNDGLGYENTGALAYGADGRTLVNGSVTATGGTTFTTNDVMMLALDMDNHDVYIGKNGTWLFSGVPDESTGAFYSDGILLSDEWGFACNGYGNPVGAYVTNFGASTFAYPQGATYNTEGFLSLSTANLSTPAIINPDDHFFSTIIDHDGSDTDGTCTFNLDTYEWLAIIKNTTGAAEKWYWIDSLRGVTKYVSSDAGAASTTDSNVLTVSGTTFTLGSTLGAKDYLVEFHKAGLAADTAANEDGSVNTTDTSANTLSGFSISRYTSTSTANQTIGHGLDIAPEFVVHKALSQAYSWAAYHVGLTSAAYKLILDQTNAQVSDATTFNSTAPTATVNAVGSDSGTWRQSPVTDYVMYSWHGVEGYSSFGSYEGNGNADGPFLNMSMDTGMFLMKSIDAARAWMYQHKEFQVNGESNYLLIYATNSLMSTSTREIDMVSTGVKLRGADGNLNHAETNIYCAWGGRALTDGAINQGRAK